MKIMYKQMFPVALGAGLWLLGNLLLVPTPAKGSDPEAQPNPGCHSENKAWVGNQNCGQAVNGHCLGNWVNGYYTISECNGADLPFGQYCDPTSPGPGRVWLEVDQGHCDFISGLCFQGNTTTRMYSFIDNQPQCSNATGITP